MKSGRSGRQVLLVGHTIAALCMAGAALADTRVSCADLAKLTLPEVISIKSQVFAGGTFTPPDGTPPVTNLPAFCRVSLVVVPKINIEVWLPDQWNERFQGVGGGGFAGAISWSGLGPVVQSGYATASTDTGHAAAVAALGALDGSFAFDSAGNMSWGQIEDFSYRSLHQLAVKGQALAKAYYGTPAKYSYWNGCSTGGRQGLAMAQRYPDDYDGILAGAPAINWDRFQVAQLWGQTVQKEDTGGPIAACKFDLANAGAYKACDASDGVTDGVLRDPRTCTFDPQVLQCTGGQSGCGCLTPGEASAIRKIWDGPRDAKGALLWYGIERTTAFSGLSGPQPFPITPWHFKWIEHDPNFDVNVVTQNQYAKYMADAVNLLGGVIGTNDPNLEPFRMAGGKLLMWHGWNDQLIYPRATVDYYKQVAAISGANTDQFVRLFMASGVAHCGGGPGPNVFGQNPSTGVGTTANNDMFKAVVRWVEQGTPPDFIIATRVDSGVATTRPLCRYPQVTTYTGVGNPGDWTNFYCANP
jgi:hypothetical protein